MRGQDNFADDRKRRNPDHADDDNDDGEEEITATLEQTSFTDPKVEYSDSISEGASIHHDSDSNALLDEYDIDNSQEDLFSELDPPELPSSSDGDNTEGSKRDGLPLGAGPSALRSSLAIPPATSEISYPYSDLDTNNFDHPTAISLDHPSDLPPDQSASMLDANLTELETAGLSLAEILSQDKFRRRIARDYQRFLTTYTNKAGYSVYHSRIRAMCAANGESLQVSYLHLVETNAFLAKLVANVPSATLAIFDEATMRVVLRLFEEYDKIRGEIHVRITDFPTLDNLRDLRYNHLGTLVRVAGVVTRRSGVFPQLKLIKYNCGRCGSILGPFVQDLNEEIRIVACSECTSRGPFTINTEQTVYRNYQKITLQESPGSVPAGRLPRHKEVVLLWDLIDSARPGELVEITGIYRNNFSYALNTKNGFPVFATILEANYVCKQADQFAEFRLTEDDQREIRALAQDPLIGLRIIRSIAPSIYGHQDIKTAIALALFSGQPKNVQGKHPIRGDINVLMLGDPGTAKSQFLKYVEKTAHRAVFATGQGASAVGLTASVRKDPVTREWTLEGGALVLADKGVCLIDEFDKMNDGDRTSIHEAMEQQSISISKAGIVTTLQARSTIIAAANPIRGRYNAALPFSQNVNLTEPILSRFDILCVVKDIVDPVMDERLARFVVGSHARSHPLGTAAGGMDTEIGALADDLQAGYQTVEPLSQDLLRKYILYAKTRVNPTLAQMDVDKVARLYADLRRESMTSGSIPITVRHIESIIRMSEAHAKMHLRDNVRSDDIDLAIRVMLESFIQAQKYSVTNHLKKAFYKYTSYRKDHAELLLFMLQELARDTLRFYQARYKPETMPKILEIDMNDFEMRAREMNIFDVRPFYASRVFSSSAGSLAAFRINAARRLIEKDI